MKQKLSILTLYTKEGASSNYRAYIFNEKLAESFELSWFNFWNKNYSGKYMHNKKKYLLRIALLYIWGTLKRLFQLYFLIPNSDILLIQKGVIPKLKPVFLTHLKRKGIRIVFDVDDAIYLFDNDNSDRIASVSDIVICGNQTLQTHYSKFNTNCVIIPTTDNINLYEPYWSNTFDKKVIGWIGSKTTVNNIDQIVSVINQLVDKYPGVSFDIISNSALDFPKKIKNTRLVQWSSQNYLKDLSKITVGIMPLEDTPINQGKCGFKLIQYLNMKKPVVGSNIGVNGEIIGKNGFAVDSERDWFIALEKLLFDRSAYQNCIKNIEEKFFPVYHYDIVAQDLIDILKGKSNKKSEV
ncbi:glycosyltransferase [Streptococcus jiangjianxini]|uniref:glycosyltransferase n=1 Tax=Streptococcus jiangjianxini TaxID=3161189 RepID=UPI0032EAF7C2